MFMMDQIECQKELLAEKSAEINDLNQRYHDASMEKLDLRHALAASQASVQQAQEEIGRLQLINRCPNAYSALVADLTRYVTDSMEEFQEGYG
jgi:predicted  nucleic acid-binding Zn-ribbon protein